MNQKEIGELRRRWKPDKNAVSKIYGCFVNSAKQIVSELDASLGLMPLEEVEKYLALFKKVLSGTLGKHLIDIVFSTRQVADSDEHRLLSGLRESGLQDGVLRHVFYQKVIEHLDMGESNYLLLIACDTYDVPHRGRDGHRGDSEEVFSYLLCCICPVKDAKPELGYFPGDNEFHYTANQIVSPPELGFLFPAFDNRKTNLYNALYYTRKPEALHQEWIDAIFHVEPPMSASEQKEAFENALSASLEGACSMEVAQSVYERLSEKIVEHKEKRDPEALTMTVEDVSHILQDCGVEERQATAFQERCAEEFGEDAVLHPLNLIDAGRYEIRTDKITVSVDPSCTYLVETRVLDGRNYLLIPVGESVEINGMAVELPVPEEIAAPV